jgi:hypothetical protein
MEEGIWKNVMRTPDGDVEITMKGTVIDRDDNGMIVHVTEHTAKMLTKTHPSIPDYLPGFCSHVGLQVKVGPDGWYSHHIPEPPPDCPNGHGPLVPMMGFYQGQVDGRTYTITNLPSWSCLRCGVNVLSRAAVPFANQETVAKVALLGRDSIDFVTLKRVAD